MVSEQATRESLGSAFGLMNLYSKESMVIDEQQLLRQGYIKDV